MPGMLSNLTNMVRDWFIQDSLFVGPGATVPSPSIPGSIVYTGSLVRSGAPSGATGQVLIGTIADQAIGSGTVAISAGNTAVVSNTAAPLYATAYPFPVTLIGDFNLGVNISGTGTTNTSVRMDVALTPAPAIVPTFGVEFYSGLGGGFFTSGVGFVLSVPAGVIPTAQLQGQILTSSGFSMTGLANPSIGLNVSCGIYG